MRTSSKVTACFSVLALLCCFLVSPGFAVGFDVVWDEPGCIESFPVQATVSWSVDRSLANSVEVRINAPDGPSFAAGPPSGQSLTGHWVNESTDFYLISPASGEVLARTRLSTISCQAERRRELAERLDGADPEKAGLVEFRLSPPRLISCGVPLERTSVRVLWDVSALETDRVEIYLGSEEGNLFAKGDAVGESETRDWVRNGTVFVLYLPDYGRTVARREFRILACGEANSP